MRKAKNQKLKLLKMYDVLRTESDEDNPMSTNTLIRRLAKEGIDVERKTLYDDIKTLNDGGYEVLCRKERANLYYVVDRQFDVAELKILIDAIQAAKFVTPKKTKQIIDKISALAGKNRAELLKRNVCVVGCPKHTNERILYSVDTIDNCIIQQKKLSFRYFDMDCKMKKVARNDNKEYIVNPVSLTINGDNYYLICYKDKYPELTSYRVDKMLDATMLDLPITKAECTKGFNVNTYKTQVFNMFSGEICQVEIMAKKELTGVIIDKFGKDAMMSPVGNHHIIATVKVQLSPQFFGWCFGLKDGVKILSPSDVVDEFSKQLSIIKEVYAVQ